MLHSSTNELGSRPSQGQEDIGTRFMFINRCKDWVSLLSLAYVRNRYGDDRLLCLAAGPSHHMHGKGLASSLEEVAWMAKLGFEFTTWPPCCSRRPSEFRQSCRELRGKHGAPLGPWNHQIRA